MRLLPRLLLVIFALSRITAITAAVPLAPAAGDRVVRQAAVVGAEFQRALTEDTTPQMITLRSYIDRDAGVRIYHRDGQLLFAISTTRNLNARESSDAARTAASLARQVLQRDFSALDADTAFQDLDSSAVRVVFIEPETLSPSFSPLPNRSRGLTGTMEIMCGGRCGGRSVGDGSTPIPFAPAGFWHGGSAASAPCVSCR